MREIPSETKRRLLKSALLSRFVEDALLDLFSRGKLYGTVHTCIGQEMSGAAVCAHLQDGDTIFSNHRCHGHFLSRHGDVTGLIAELMGRQSGVSGGIGGSQHLCKEGFFSNGIQGGIVPVAAGLALGHKLKGKSRISTVFIGDGTLGEGVIYETFNIAAKWGLPLLIVLEDNKYSQSTSQNETLSGDIRARAEAFGIEAAHGDTWNWQQLHETAGELISGMRKDNKPRFLHVETYRLKAHSKGDDIRERAEVAVFEEKDPLNLFLASATPEDRIWIDELQESVTRAIAVADQAPPAVFEPVTEAPGSVTWQPASMPAESRVVVALNEALTQLMAEYPGTTLIGEDILSPYGGAFKASKGLSDRFPDRVRNTPISEGAIVGIGTGLGMTGHHALVEIMFGDFLGLAFDQLVNHAAKFREMYNYQVQPSVTVRTPMGGGRGYGPTHSQTLDRHFFGVPGLRMLALNNLTDPVQLYRPLLSTQAGPTLVIENKRLYGSYMASSLPEGYELLHSDEQFPTAWIRPATSRIDVTLLGYGGICEMMQEACDVLFDEHDLVAQVLCPMQIFPFSLAPLRDVLGRSDNLLIIEEGQGFAGFAAEVMAQLAEHDVMQGMRVRRLYAAPHCIPASGSLEADVLPDVGKLVQAVLRMV